MKNVSPCLLFMILLIFMSSGFAQEQNPSNHKQVPMMVSGGKTPEEIARVKTEWVKAELQLDEVTEERIYNVYLKFIKITKEEQNKIVREFNQALKVKTNEINALRDRELEKILGGKDFELFKAKDAERKQELMQRIQ